MAIGNRCVIDGIEYGCIPETDYVRWYAVDISSNMAACYDIPRHMHQPSGPFSNDLMDDYQGLKYYNAPSSLEELYLNQLAGIHSEKTRSYESFLNEPRIEWEVIARKLQNSLQKGQ